VQRTGAEMVREDLQLGRRDAMVKLAGFPTFDHHE
jgi:hypothetical protein